MGPRRIITGLGLATALSLAVTGNVHAYNISIDQFYIEKNGSKYVNDTFSDGIAPPSSDDTFGSGTAPVSYNTLGLWTESGGRAHANSANGLNTTSFLSGNPLTLSRARVNSNTDPNNLLFGLKNDDTFQVRALYDLSSTLDGPGGFGIRLDDFVNLSSPGNDQSEISVRRKSDGSRTVRFADVDRSAATLNVLDEVTLASGHDQILLMLTRATTSSGISASFAFVDGGSIDIGDNALLAGLTFTDMAGISNIFDGEVFTRAQFNVIEVQVPEPGMIAILGLAVAGIGLTRRRKRA